MGIGGIQTSIPQHADLVDVIGVLFWCFVLCGALKYCVGFITSFRSRLKWSTGSSVWLCVTYNLLPIIFRRIVRKYTITVLALQQALKSSMLLICSPIVVLVTYCHQIFTSYGVEDGESYVLERACKHLAREVWH